MCILPTAKLFNFYYTKSTRPNNSWIYFATRLGKKHFVDDLSNIPMMNYGKCFTYLGKKEVDVGGWDALSYLNYAYAKILYELPSY